jgi:hypothetical protein
MDYLRFYSDVEATKLWTKLVTVGEGARAHDQGCLKEHKHSWL